MGRMMMTEGEAAAAELATADGGAAAEGGAAALGTALGTTTTAAVVGTGATTGAEVATATAVVWVLPGQLVTEAAQDVTVTISVS